MKGMASLNDERDDLIDPFVQKAKAAGPHSLHAENKDSPHEEKIAPSNGESTPKQRSGDVVMKWIENRLEIERKLDIAVNELHKRQTIFENKVLSELQSMNDKLSGLQSMNDNDSGYKEDDGVEVVSPHPRRVRNKKCACVLLAPYTDPTKRKKFRKRDVYKFDPFRTIDQPKQEAFRKWFDENDTSTLIDCGTYSVSRNFFKKLIEPGIWLEGEHIDAALYALRKRSQKYFDLFDQKVAILDDQFAKWIKGHC
ncbi:hypothetical protein TorRG33x02_277220, partial [Trema orientale]